MSCNTSCGSNKQYTYNYLCSNFVHTPSATDTTIQIYDINGVHRFTLDPYVTSFYAKSRFIYMLVENKKNYNNVLDFQNNAEAECALVKLNTIKKLFLDRTSTSHSYPYIPLSGSSNIYGNLIPQLNDMYHLGSNDYNWIIHTNNIYISGISLHYGDSGLTFGGDVIATSNNYYDKTEIDIMMSGITSSGITYTGPSTTTVGGIEPGYFSGASMQDMWYDLLNPLVNPSCSISCTDSTREYGDPSTTTTLNWSVIKGTNIITSINVNGSPITPTGGNQSGSNGATVTINVTNTYGINCSTGSESTNSSTSVRYRLRRFWGPNSSILLNNSDVLQFESDGTSELSTSRNKTYTQSCNNEYIYYCYPESWGDATFTVNGFTVTFDLQILPVTNSFGYGPVNYRIYKSLNLQNGTNIPIVVT